MVLSEIGYVGHATNVFPTSLAHQRLIQAMALSKSANLSDNDKTAAHRARYTDPAQAPARSSPVVTGCDVLTSNTWFNGEILSRTMESYAKMLTSGTAQYCITAQEDNATLEALLRGAQTERMNFSRVISTSTHHHSTTTC